MSKNRHTKDDLRQLQGLPLKLKVRMTEDYEIVFTTLQMDAEKAKKIACDHYARLKYQKEVNA